MESSTEKKPKTYISSKYIKSDNFCNDNYIRKSNIAMVYIGKIITW